MCQEQHTHTHHFKYMQGMRILNHKTTDVGQRIGSRAKYVNVHSPHNHHCNIPASFQ